MSNDSCDHVGAVCVIGNYWQCAECEAEKKDLRGSAKIPSFSMALLGAPAIKQAPRKLKGLPTIQSTASDWTIERLPDPDPDVYRARITMPVHDYIYSEGKKLSEQDIEDIEYVRKRLREAITAYKPQAVLKVPITVEADVGDSWANNPDYGISPLSLSAIRGNKPVPPTEVKLKTLKSRKK